MIKVYPDTKTIQINRGDDGLGFDFKIPINDTDFYTFQTTDTIKFGVYEAKGLDKPAVLLKEIVPAEESQTLHITFTKEEMTIGQLINKPVDYWYEIQLNDKTVIGYEKINGKDDPKIFTLLPEGSDTTNGSGGE